ncbi:MAG: lipid-A-disaccharide synthase [Hyphomicrobiaceae bacterium]
MTCSDASARSDNGLRLFVVAGEHSGDALGGKLMQALRASWDGAITFAGVGGDLMQAQGLESLFPLSDIAVMGPIAIAKRLPLLVRRVRQTVDAAIAFAPGAVVIIDAPEFTHAVAKRIRRRCPQIPIIDYVSPTVWAWRPGRARAMRPYVDHLMALLPFEPAAHARLGGPPCTYVGHPLVEQLDWIRALDPSPLASRLGLCGDRQVIAVLPGSRASEVARLFDVFRETVRLLGANSGRYEVLMPVVPAMREQIARQLSDWPRQVHLIDGDEDKWRAFKLADAALAASGTVTLELAAAGVPTVVAYKVEPLVAPLLRRMIRTDKAALANHVLGDMIFPEFMQEDCMPENLSAALAELLRDGPTLLRQREALARVPDLLAVNSGSPSAAAAAIVLEHASTDRRPGRFSASQ